MLSNRSERKVQSLLSAMDEETLEGMRGQLMEIKDVFQQTCQSDTPDQAGRFIYAYVCLYTQRERQREKGRADVGKDAGTADGPQECLFADLSDQRP